MQFLPEMELEFQNYFGIKDSNVTVFIENFNKTIAQPILQIMKDKFEIDPTVESDIYTEKFVNYFITHKYTHTPLRDLMIDVYPDGFLDFYDFYVNYFEKEINRPLKPLFEKEKIFQELNKAQLFDYFTITEEPSMGKKTLLNN